MRTIQCPKCQVELTIPDEAGSRRLRCPQCAERFYPSGRPASSAGSSGATHGPASSIMAQSVEAPRPAKRVTVPPSSGMHRASGASSGGYRAASNGEYRAPSGDLRDLMDIPLADDDRSARPPSRMPDVADAAALFRDEAPAPRRKLAAEARQQARRCPTCHSVVLAGMSLCERCGLDLDTGQRIDLEEEVDDAPVMTRPAGPPMMVLMIGIVAMAASGVLAMLAMLLLDQVGMALLTPVCLFGVVAAAQFLRGKTMRLLAIALMIGGAVDVVTLIVLPAVQAEVAVAPHAFDKAAKGEADADSDAAAPAADAPLAERIDGSKLTLGIVILLVDAAILLCLSTSGVRHHFERRCHARDEGYVIP